MLDFWSVARPPRVAPRVLSFFRSFIARVPRCRSLEPPYCRACDTSTTLDPAVASLPNRKLCRHTGPESENAAIWVERMARRGWAPPASALKLVQQRLYVLNPVALGYVKPSGWREGEALPVRLGPRADGNGSVYNNAFTSQFTRFFRTAAFNREALATLCRPLPSPTAPLLWASPDDWVAPVYNCSMLVGDPSDPTTGVVATGRTRHMRDWACPAPDSAAMLRKWSAKLGPACAPTAHYN